MAKTKDPLLERGKKLKGGKAKKIPNAPGVKPKIEGKPYEVKPKVRHKYNNWVMEQPMEQILKLNEICSKDRKPVACMKAASPTRQKRMF